MEENEDKKAVSEVKVEPTIVETSTGEPRPVEARAEAQKPVEKKTKKKLPVGLKILLFPFTLLFVLLVVVLIWFTFCFFDRIKSIDALPPDYAVYLRTDSVWDAAEPLLDLDATLIAMTSPELQKYRESYLQIKKSKLRTNFFVKTALSRRVDAAVYSYEENGSAAPAVIAVLDAGILSGALRLSPFIIPHIKPLAKNLELASNRHGNIYQLKSSGFFVIKKNLIIFSTNKNLLEQAMTYSNSSLYKAEEFAAVNAKLKEPMRIFANGQNLLKLFTEKPSTLLKTYLESIVPYLSTEEYTSLTFGITNKELNVMISVPMTFDNLDSAENLIDQQPVIKLLKKESIVPSFLPKLNEDVQYYTLFSAGTISELKDAVIKILPPEKDFTATWNKADSVSRIVFNCSLDDILFSWTGDEFAVFGIEGKSEPVFGIKIADEVKRQEIFDRIFSSYIIQSNDSLLVNGVRLPCIQVPSFLMSILQAFNVNIPKPYYLVKDGYIFFSQSPENLVAINFDAQSSRKLSGSKNWTRVSSRQSPYSTLSLYYNLERSVPFFIKGNSAMSKILSLYNSGRFDLRIKDNLLSVQLQASAVELESSRNIPGFPIELENKTNSMLVKSSSKKGKQIFWVESDSSANALDCATFTREKTELPDLQYLVEAGDATVKANGGEIWAITKSGMVYLLNSKLESVLGYPILSGVTMSCEPFIYRDSLVLVGTDGTLNFISNTGELTRIETGIESEIKTRPAVSGDIIAFYEKGFFGGIHIYKNMENITAEGPLELEGIAYGSPCLFAAGGKQYVSMITQAGELYVYDLNGNLLDPFPVVLPGVFYLNVEMADGYLIALSSEGDLFRVGLDGKSLKVKIPYFTAKTGRITVTDYDEKTGQEIFVSGEGNSLYGFNTMMELLPKFPVSGYGNPLFIDLDGDNKNDCLAITFDNKISAANVLK